MPGKCIYINVSEARFVLPLFLHNLPSKLFIFDSPRFVAFTSLNHNRNKASVSNHLQAQNDKAHLLRGRMA